MPPTFVKHQLYAKDCTGTGQKQISRASEQSQAVPASFKKLILRNLSSMIIAIFRTVSHLQNLYYPSLLEEFSTDLSNVLFIIFICLAFSNKGFDFDLFFF